MQGIGIYKLGRNGFDPLHIALFLQCEHPENGTQYIHVIWLLPTVMDLYAPTGNEKNRTGNSSCHHTFWFAFSLFNRS